MKIKTPPVLYAGDTICCPKCGKGQFRVRKNILPGMALDGADFKPVNQGQTLQSGSPLVCFECGENLWNGHTFREVERDAQSYLENHSGKDGLEEA